VCRCEACPFRGRPDAAFLRADLLIAAVAARHAMTVIHYNSDYEIIASVTRQPTRWAAPRGSL
jgi:predicted nucleic acid-binding protein